MATYSAPVANKYDKIQVGDRLIMRAVNKGSNFLAYDGCKATVKKVLGPGSLDIEVTEGFKKGTKGQWDINSDWDFEWDWDN